MVQTFLAAAWMCVLVALAGRPALAEAQTLVADPAVLHLRATQSPDGQWHSTPSRIVRLDRTDRAVRPWRAESTVPWLTVAPTSGAGPARLSVQADPARLDGTSAVGEVVISIDGATSQRVAVHVFVVTADQPPMGFFDAPVDGEVAEGEVRLFGWALDDVGVSSIEICRAGEARRGEEGCADGKGARVGYAELHAGDRPDVAAALPGFEHEGRVGWTAVLSMSAGGWQPPAAPTPYYALGRDVAGHVALMGTRTYQVVRAAVSWGRLLKWPAVLLLSFVVFAALHQWGRRWLPAGQDVPSAVGQSGHSAPGLVELVALFAIVAAFAWVVIPSLSRSLEYDEMYSASQFIVERSWWESATRVQTYNNHFGNSILASAFVRALGPHEWVVRLPAFLLALGAIIVTWRFGRRLSGPVVGLCAAALLAASPAFLLWAQTARGYSGLACMAWLSVDAFFRVLRTGDPRQARVHTMSTAVLPLFHLFGFWILAIEYLAFWAWSLAGGRVTPSAVSGDGLRRLHRSFLIIGVFTLVMFLPSVGDLVADRPVFAVPSVPSAPSATAPSGSGTVVSRGDHWGVQWAGLAVELLSSRSWTLMAIAGGLMVVGFLRLPKGEASLGVAVLVVPLLLLLLAGKTIVVFPRFFSFWLPMLAVFLSAGIVAPFQWQRSLTRRALRGAAIVVGIATLAGGLWLARAWLDRGPSGVSAPGYREWLTPPPDWAGSPVVVVGQDAFMFDFYVGRSASHVDDPAHMDGLLRQNGRLLVALHAPRRNVVSDRPMRDLLMRKCLDRSQGNIILFECR